MMLVGNVLESFTGFTAAAGSRRTLTSVLRNVIAVLLIVITTAASLILPVGKIPKPQGSYKVGTVSYYVEDSTRKEIYTEDSGDVRKIMLQAWYPADDVKGHKRAPWLEGGKSVAIGLARLMKLPDFLLTHLALVESNSYENAELSNAQDKYPVVVISHGWTGFRNIHTNFAEMLASSGYVVVAVDHTYGSLATAFENGETVYLNRNALPSGIPKGEFAKYSNNLVSTYAGDIITTLDRIEKINREDSRFRNRLDLDRIGLMGHSTGGGGSVKAAIMDNRIKAVFGLDPWVEPVDKELIAKGLSVPAVFLRSEQWKDKPNNANLFALMGNSKNDIQLYSITGVIHNDFTIVNIISPAMKYLKMRGALEGKKSMDIQHDYVLSFFDKYLRGENHDLLNQKKSPYSEVSNIFSKGKQLN
jgi:pimeloyl-ACP methyl ester carboxylesterase